MRCECCFRRRRFLESFVPVNSDNDETIICSECNDLLLRIRDSFNDGQYNQNKALIQKLDERMTNPTGVFVSWKDKFVDKYRLILLEDGEVGYS